MKTCLISAGSEIITKGGASGRRMVNLLPYRARQRSRKASGRFQNPMLWINDGYDGPGGTPEGIAISS